MGFDEDIKRISRQLEKGLTEKVKDTSLAVLSAVALATPVGNKNLWQNPKAAPPGYAGGHARGNWQLGISTVSDAELEVRDAGGSATISKGRSTLASYKLGPNVVIGNNAPYIVPLNNGHSTQAPIGFIERAAQAATREAERGPGVLPR